MTTTRPWDFIFKEDNTSYMDNERIIAFSQDPLHSFISTLTRKDRIIVTNSDDYLFVASNYNWAHIRYILEQIVVACDDIPSPGLTDLLIQTWKHVPAYLRMFLHFYKHHLDKDYMKLSFMHLILTNKLPSVQNFQIKYSMELSDDYYLSLDTSIVTKLHDPFRAELTFGRFISKSKARLICAVEALQNYVWKDIDFDVILESVKNNRGTRYFNISSNSFVNAKTTNKLKNVSRYHKVAASKRDTELFSHVIYLLNNAYIQSSLITPMFESDSDVKSTSNKYLTDSSEDTNTKDNQVKPLKIKRKKIPQKIRQMTWRKYIGNTMDGNCWCCDEIISFEKWQAGQIIPASKGGPDTVKNLRPLCHSCNLSMGASNMGDFINKYDMKGKGADEFAKI